MDQPKKNKNARSHRPERITLTDSNLAQVDEAIEKVKEHLCGGGISRSQFVNEIISRHTQTITDSLAKEIAELYFDPAAVLAWAARKAKEAQRNGEAVKLEELLPVKLTRKKKARKSAGEL